MRAGLLLHRGGESGQPVSLPFFGQIPLRRHDREKLFGVPSQEIAHRMGAFDYEGAFRCSHPPLMEELPNMRALRTREERESHASTSQ